MNNHMIIGVVASEVKLMQSLGGTEYLSFKVQDSTRYNGEDNQVNNFPVIKYGRSDELAELKDTLSIGTVVYVIGEGLYNKRHFYNIIISRIEVINTLNVEIVEKRAASYYESFFNKEAQNAT